MLSLFGLGWADGSYRFALDGRLQPYWKSHARHPRSLTLAIIVASAASAVNAATDQTNSLLIEQGLFWQGRLSPRR